MKLLWLLIGAYVMGIVVLGYLTYETVLLIGEVVKGGVMYGI